MKNPKAIQVELRKATSHLQEITEVRQFGRGGIICCSADQECIRELLQCSEFAAHPPPQPYSFGYDNVDEFGNRQFHSEQADSNNAKTGSYGYRNVNGLYRRVNYVADAYGFRATVDTNEPGTAPGASADAVFNAAPVVPPFTSRNVQGGAAAAFATRVAAPYNAGSYSGYGRYRYNPYASATGAYGFPPYGRQEYSAGAPPFIAL
ncbi:hypothetical protein HPB51_014461 [Rhipicephalus microplus]|uniref:Cuticle protein n=1 Tax=Rhipicephalus microplus TaxID=6941 RepID=A0A9J6D5J3_RHIMP|nr:hypothetical protein HPB51_014461 [Rhipicephalus microplus]